MSEQATCQACDGSGQTMQAWGLMGQCHSCLGTGVDWRATVASLQAERDELAAENERLREKVKAMEPACILEAICAGNFTVIPNSPQPTTTRAKQEVIRNE